MIQWFLLATTLILFLVVLIQAKKLHQLTQKLVDLGRELSVLSEEERR